MKIVKINKIVTNLLVRKSVLSSQFKDTMSPGTKEEKQRHNNKIFRELARIDGVIEGIELTRELD